jgi:hypothetical protein
MARAEIQGRRRLVQDQDLDRVGKDLGQHQLRFMPVE